MNAPHASSDSPAASPDPAAQLRPPLWTAVPRAIWPVIVGVALAFCLQEFLVPGMPTFSSVIAFAGINVLLAVSLNLVNGFAGQFSIGHAGFMALGGYFGAAIVYYGTAVIYGDFNFHGGWISYLGSSRNTPEMPVRGGELLFLGGCILGGLISVCAGYLVGLPSLRLRGDYLAIVTLGFGEIVRVLLEGTPNQLGPYGLSDAERATLEQTPFPGLLYRVGGPQAFNGLPTYSSHFWIYVWVAIVLAVAVRVKYSGYGRSLLSIREDVIAARSIGVDVTRYNVRAFMLSAFFAGIAGVLTALYVGQIKAGDLGFSRSFEIVIMVVLGGLGSISGAVMAAVLLTFLPEVLRDPPTVVSPPVLATIVVLAVLIALRSPKRLRGLAVLIGVCLAYELCRWAADASGRRLSDFRMIIYAFVLVMLMILRPQGLLGVHEIWDVWPLNRLPMLRRRLGNLPATTGDVPPAAPPAGGDAA